MSGLFFGFGSGFWRFLFGRPYGRSVDSRSKRRAIDSTQPVCPNGRRRRIDHRVESSSSSSRGSLTFRVQFPERGVGHGDSNRGIGHSTNPIGTTNPNANLRERKGPDTFTFFSSCRQGLLIPITIRAWGFYRLPLFIGRVSRSCLAEFLSLHSIELASLPGESVHNVDINFNHTAQDTCLFRCDPAGLLFRVFDRCGRRTGGRQVCHERRHGS